MSAAPMGALVIVSGPSGVGKSTILRRLVERFAGRLRLSVSATTRPRRPGEEDGRDYFFLSPEEFRRRREKGEFLECNEVYGRGHWYGTLRSEVESSLAAGKWVILEIDVEGAESILDQFPAALTIFLRTADEAELERRLRARGTETEESVRRRLEVARRELARADRYDYQVKNESVDQAVDEISEILMARGLNKT